MSYIPTEWKTGDIITADKLNNLEHGVENSQIFEIVKTSETEVNRSAEEILDAINNGKKLFFVYSPSGGPTSGSVVRIPLVYFDKERIDDEWTPTGEAVLSTIQFIGPASYNKAETNLGMHIAMLKLNDMTLSEYNLTIAQN